MNALKFDLERLLHGPVELDFSVPPADFELLEDPEYTFNEPVEGKLVARLVGDENILVEGSVSTAASAECARCLSPLRFPLRVAVQLLFLPKPSAAASADPEGEDDLLFYDGHTVYPMERLREELMLALPFLPKCELVDGKACAEAGVANGPLVFGPRDATKPGSSPAEPVPATSWQGQLAAVKKQMRAHGN